MKRYFRLSALALLAIFSLISGSAYAAVTHTDGDIYGDAYTVESSTGNWTLAGNQTVQGNQTVSGNMTVSGTTTGKKNVTLINATASTVGTVTLAKSGYVFVVRPLGDSNNYMFTLPSTNSTTSGVFTGETYTFTTASGTTLKIRTPFATDSTIAFGGPGSGVGITASITSPASTGTTVTVVGDGRVWYISSMGYGSDKTNVWTASATA